MAKKPTAQQTQTQNSNHKGNQVNANKGTSGTNIAYDKVHGNRGGQLNPNRKGS